MEPATGVRPIAAALQRTATTTEEVGAPRWLLAGSRSPGL